jgi:uncharacterized phage-associated protein
MQTPKSYPARVVANTFLSIAWNEGKQLTPLKLQKLVYYAHAWNLALFDRPLIAEDVEYWPYGPVVASLYHEFREFGGDHITRLAKEARSNDAHWVPPNDREPRRMIERIWKLLGDCTGTQLSNLSHSRDEPWALTPRKFRGATISNDLIKQCFSGKLKSPTPVP